MMEGPRYEVHLGEKAYPPKLMDLEHPPETLYVLGNREVFERPGLSVIGAREATPYGISAARMAGRVAAECNVVLVSGGALGCDSEAARAALGSGGTTIVVAGTGADYIYPARSRDVFQHAIERGGAVISVRPWGSPPERFGFPQRNPIIAALGDALLVCEAGLRSGTSSTAEAAGRLGRQIYAVPGSIFSPYASGTNRLIADGATIICDEQDLEMTLSLDFGCLRMSEGGVARTENRLLSALMASPTRPDELASLMGLDVLELLRELSELEVRGFVERMRDGRYAPTTRYLLGRSKMEAKKV